jgi:60 kDa SS-A/Ro ribonucleoprotein
VSAIARNIQSPSGVVTNNAGGLGYKISGRERLARFLILGTDGGTFYVSEKSLTESNLSFVDEMIRKEFDVVVDVARDVSVNGKAYSQHATIYVVARVLCTCTEDQKQAAKLLVNDTIRTFTHLAEFMGWVSNFGGWGQAKMAAVRKWYESKTSYQLAYQAVKYPNRKDAFGKSWNMRDGMRLSHPKGVDQRVGDYILGNPVYPGGSDIIAGAIAMKNASSTEEVLAILAEFPALPFEAIPTHFRNAQEVWPALFYNGQLRGQALLRNIRNIAGYGSFIDLRFAADVGNELQNPSSRSRLHPVQYLFAMGANGILKDTPRAYYSAASMKPPKSMVPGPIVDGLEAGFYASFKNAPNPARSIIAVDVSPSMQDEIRFGSDRRVGSGVTCAQAAAVMAMVVARNSPAYHILGFSTNVIDLGITGCDKLSSVMRKTSGLPFGGTNIAAPIEWATRRGVDADVFIAVTDNEDLAGGGYWGREYRGERSRPMDALAYYRRTVNHPVGMVSIGLTSTDVTVGDPGDPHTLDVVGFDPSVPQVISNFLDMR